MKTMNLRKWVMALATILMPLSMMAANATLSIENFDIKAGETKEMVIDLNNPSDEITLVQFDLSLPNGLSVATDGGDFAIDIAGRTTWKKHSLDANATDGIIRFLLSSTKNAVLEGTSGAIISITLTANSSFTSGVIRLKNILLVTPDEHEVKPADVEYTIGGGDTPTPGGDWHDGDEFTAKTVEGIDMKFKVISAEDKTCQVGYLTYTDEDGDDKWSSIDLSTKGTVTIPATVNGLKVVKVGNSAFVSCDKLESIIVPEGVKEISGEAFLSCKSVTDIQLPQTLQIIGENAFMLCTSLREITIPQNVTEFGYSIFWYCTSLVSIHSLNCNPQNAKRAFDDGEISSQATLYVPIGCKAKYQATEGWKNFKNIVEEGGQMQTSAYLSIEPFSIKAGETKEMFVDLTNPEDEITLVQFDMRLPAGLSLKQTGGEYDIDMCDRTTWRRHSLEANALGDIIRFLLASSSNTIISGTEGGIIKMTLIADANYMDGVIRLEKILLVTPDEKEIKPADVIASGIADVVADKRNTDAVFSLSGQRLSAPKKGINIVDGRKVIIK